MKQPKRKSGSRSAPDEDERFRRAFEYAPTAMALLSNTAEIIHANPAFQSLLLSEPTTSLDTSFPDVIGADDCDNFMSDFHQLVAGEIDRLDKKLICKSPNGKSIQVVTKVSQTRSADDEFQFAIVQLQDITDAANLMLQLEYQASYDELTGLLNRRAFTTELERAWVSREQGGKPCFLMFMDLDQFKVVNDTSGHQAGDQLLKSIGEVLVDSVRTNDTVARQGGDEFAILLWDCPARNAADIAESIRASIEKFRFHWGWGNVSSRHKHWRYPRRSRTGRYKRTSTTCRCRLLCGKRSRQKQGTHCRRGKGLSKKASRSSSMGTAPQRGYV